MRNFASTFISPSVFVTSGKDLGVYFPQIEVEEHNYDITYEYCKNTVIVDVGRDGRDLQLQGGALICVNYRK